MNSDSDAPPSSPPLDALSASFTTKVPTKLSSPKSPKLPPRKRARSDDQGYHSASSAAADVSSNSSDAPFFSSDDLGEADAAHYASPLRKKQYRRKWYEPERDVEAFSYRTMRSVTKQQNDSGIYMNSDSSSSSFSEGFEVETANIKARAVQAQSKKMQAFIASDKPLSLANNAETEQSPREQVDASHPENDIVEKTVSACVDLNREELDLTGLHLGHLPSGCFAPLQHFVKQPAFCPDKYTDAACAPLTPSLKIFLATNQLTSLPASLFDLQYLTVLSLRNNSITELSPSIGRLRNLQELNLNGNPLCYLPWEIIGLIYDSHGKHAGPLQRLSVSSTEMTRLCSQIQTSKYWKDRYSEHVNEKAGVQILGATVPTLYENDGALSRHSAAPNPARIIEGVLYGNLKSKMTHGHTCQDVSFNDSRTPSLFELALRSCATSTVLPELPGYLPPDAPPAVFTALAHANEVVDREGSQGRTCTVCGRTCFIVRAEWLEVASLNSNRSHGSSIPLEPLPFLRRVCSWQCAKDVQYSVLR